MRDWIGLAVIALPCMLYTMDLTILNVAVPTISAELMPTASQLLWIVDIYGFFVAGALLIMGALGDRIGRRRLLMIGATSFGLVSVLASLAPNTPMLILSRALLGIAGATLAPSTLSLISSMFRNDRQRTFAVSVWIASFSFGAALGPIIGGLLLDHFSWRVLFLVPVPTMLLLLAVGPLLLPEFKAPSARGLDLVSAALSVATILPIVYGIKLFAEGAPAAWSIGMVVPGLLCGTIFVRRQLTLSDPFLDLRLLTQRALAAALGVNVFNFFAIFGIGLPITQYMQLVLGLTPLQAGLWSLPDGLGFVVGSLFTSSLLKRMRPAYALCLGLACGVTGLLVMTQIGGPHSLIILVVGMMLFAIGLAPCAAIVADLTVSASPPERAGAASALNETSSEFGGALGIALLGSLATLVYRSMLAPSLPPSLDPGTAEIALRGIASATEIIEGMGASGAPLLDAARSAYSSAVQLGFLTAAIVLGAAALVSLLVLRQGKPAPVAVG